MCIQGNNPHRKYTKQTFHKLNLIQKIRNRNTFDQFQTVNALTYFTMFKISPSDKKEKIEVGFPKENVSSFKFESALKPFIFWLKLSTGVDITWNQRNGTKTHKVGNNIYLFLYGICLLFFNFACTGIFKYVYLQQRFASTFSKAGPLSTTERINMMSVFFITGWEYIFICCTHLCFFAVQSKFKALWNALMMIEKELKPGHLTHRCIRQSLWIGFAVVLLVRHFESIQAKM